MAFAVVTVEADKKNSKNPEFLVSGCFFMAAMQGTRRRRWKNMVMLGWISVVYLCRSLAHFKRCSVVQSIARLLDNGSLSKPLPLVKDGDLIVHHMILAKRSDTIRATKVKGLATEADVEQGRVRREY